MGKEGGFECDVVFGARQTGLGVSETADLPRFLLTVISRVSREWPKMRKYCIWQEGMSSLYQGMQNTISEHMSNLKVDELQQQKTTPSGAPVS